METVQGRTLRITLQRLPFRPENLGQLGIAQACKTRRLAHGFRNFEHYRLRILLAADGSRPYKRRPREAVNHAES